MKKQFLLGLMAMLLPLTSWAQADFTVTVSPKADKTFVYAGDETKNNVEVKVTVKFAGDEEAETLTENTHFKVVSYHNSTTNEDILRNAGNYTVTIQGLDAYRGYTIPAGSFKIERAELKNLTFSAGEKEYGATLADANLSGAVNITAANGLLTGQEEQEEELKNALSCLTLDFVTGAETVGENNIVTIKGLEDDKNPSNYYYAEEGAPIYVRITPRVLTATLADAEKVYIGKEVELSNLTPEIETSKIVGDDVVTVSFVSVKDDAELKNVGKYTLIAELDGKDAEKYTLAKNGEVDYEITRATLKIEQADGASLKKTYDGKIGLQGKTNLTSLYKVTSETVSDVSFESLGLIMQVKAAAADGMNKAKYLVHPNNGAKNLGTEEYKTPETGIMGETELSNYIISYDRDNLQFEIEPKTVKYYFTQKINKKYTGKEITLAETDYDIAFDGDNEFVEGETWAEDGKPTAKFADEYEEVINAGPYNLEVATEGKASDNYTIVFLDEKESGKNVYTVGKADVTIAATDKELEFDAERDYETLQKTWTTKSAEVVTITGAKTGTDGSALRKIYTLTFVPKKEGMKVGDSGEYDIELALIEDDELDPADKAVKDNYDVEFKNGTLTIKGVSELELDADNDLLAVVKENAGATVTTVTVKNLKNFIGTKNTDMYEKCDTIEAKMWYTLTLPFDVSVRDLSRELGYAIVNVPNLENTKSDVYFKLTMDTIPANTLMAFKVDQTIVRKELKFTGKTIVAPAEEYKKENGNADAAGNEFHVVYDEEQIDKATQKYLFPGDGKFYPADKESTWEDYVTLYPLNGYVECNNAGARIFMQEADGSTTAIDAVTGKVISNSNDGWYTVGGMKLNAQPTQKGIYINNGKKVVVK